MFPPVVPTLGTPILASPSPWPDVYCGPLLEARTTRHNSRVSRAAGAFYEPSTDGISCHTPQQPVFFKYVLCFSLFSNFPSVNTQGFCILKHFHSKNEMRWTASSHFPDEDTEAETSGILPGSSPWVRAAQGLGAQCGQGPHVDGGQTGGIWMRARGHSNGAVSSMVTPREGMGAPTYWTLLCASQEVPLTHLPWDGGAGWYSAYR